MKTREMNFKEIERLFRLMNYTDGTDKVRVSDMAKEGGWKRTDLAEYLIENGGHYGLVQFDLVSSNRPKKNPGLYIIDCYEDVADNPNTDEWLDRHIADNRDKFFFWKHEADWGCRYSYVFEVDDGRDGLWRNTAEKMERLLGIGGYQLKGERYLEYTEDSLEKLKEAGIGIVL